MNVRNAQARVRDFHQVMTGDKAAPQEPIPLAEYNGHLRCSLIDEEASEFRTSWERRDRVAMIDALSDLIYVTLGAAVEMGVDIEPFLEEVHRSNMTKVGGRVREDGKQLKPDGWRAPDIAGVYAKLYGQHPAGEPRQEILQLSTRLASEEMKLDARRADISTVLPT